MSYGGNQPLLMALAVSAIDAVGHLDEYWALQRRHGDDGERWLDLAHYLTRDDASSALERVVETDHATREELRVEHIRRRPD